MKKNSKGIIASTCLIIFACLMQLQCLTVPYLATNLQSAKISNEGIGMFTMGAGYYYNPYNYANDFEDLPIDFGGIIHGGMAKFFEFGFYAGMYEMGAQGRFNLLGALANDEDFPVLLTLSTRFGFLYWPVILIGSIGASTGYNIDNIAIPYLGINYSPQLIGQFWLANVYTGIEFFRNSIIGIIIEFNYPLNTSPNPAYNEAIDTNYTLVAYPSISFGITFKVPDLEESHRYSED